MMNLVGGTGWGKGLRVLLGCHCWLAQQCWLVPPYWNSASIPTSPVGVNRAIRRIDLSLAMFGAIVRVRNESIPSPLPFPDYHVATAE